MVMRLSLAQSRFAWPEKGVPAYGVTNPLVYEKKTTHARGEKWLVRCDHERSGAHPTTFIKATTLLSVSRIEKWRHFYGGQGHETCIRHPG